MTILIRFFHACFAWAVVIMINISYFLIATSVMFFFRNPKEAHMRMAKPFVRVILWSCRVRIHIKGSQYLKGKGPFIVMCNHVSMLDIILMILTLPFPFKFIAKKELGAIPFLGWSMRLQGQYMINRKESKKAYSLIDQVIQDVKNGQSIVIFPEGTRSQTGALAPFKRGGFKLAVASGATIIPACLHNVENILPKKSWILKPGAMTVTFGEPIAYDSFRTDGNVEESSIQSLKERVQSAILNLKKKGPI